MTRERLVVGLYWRPGAPGAPGPDDSADLAQRVTTGSVTRATLGSPAALLQGNAQARRSPVRSPASRRRRESVTE